MTTHRGGSRRVERSTTAAEKAEVTPDNRNAGRRPTAAANVTTTLYSAVTILNKLTTADSGDLHSPA
ncbi:hypothetical protein J6590_078385 [Homalodisca vitripennis]|nr:hypothetical protein J6590_078385 [Homalodisca vitripennis]